ncbi:MAG: hypothetical protein OXB95_05495 [Rhodobacteraceae bacterium]|nr:hypothetical protein [Paracoccaceae bacterium]
MWSHSPNTTEGRFNGSPFALLAATLAGALGCSGTNESNETRIAATERATEQALEDFAKRDQEPPVGVRMLPGNFLGAQSEPRRQLEDFPESLLLEDAIILSSASQLSMEEILDRLTAITGLNHRVVGQSGMGGDVGLNPGLPLGQATFRPDLQGTLPEVLDAIAAVFDANWRYRSGQVEFLLRELRQYHLLALPKTSSASASIGAFASSASLDIANEIIESITGIAGEAAQVHYATGTGILSVTASPSVHERVSRHVEHINASLSQQIAFDVTLLTVGLKRSGGFGANLRLLSKKSNGKIADFVSNHSLAGSSDSVNVGFMVGDYELNALVTALQEHGHVSVETRTGATTSNNRIVPIQVIREVAYARDVVVSEDAQGNSQTTISPGKFTTGFEMYLFPRVINSMEVLLNFSVRISELDELANFTSNHQSIQLPSISTTVFEQQSVLGNGETLVLAGFERNRVVNDKGGFWPLGGKSRSSTERVATVLLVRSRILRRRT